MTTRMRTIASSLFMLASGAALAAAPGAESPCTLGPSPPEGPAFVVLAAPAAPAEDVTIWSAFERGGARAVLLVGVARGDGSGNAALVAESRVRGGTALTCILQGRLEEALAQRAPAHWRTEAAVAEPPANRTSEYYLAESARLAAAGREESALRFRVAGLSARGLAAESDDECRRLSTMIQREAREGAVAAYERDRVRARERGDRRSEAEAESALAALSGASAADVDHILALWSEVAPAGMVLVNGGSFLMGSEKGDADTRPVHAVTVSSFFLGQREVTVSEFETFARAKGVNRPPFATAPRFSSPQQPVVGVSWKAAAEFCAWRLASEGLAGRLPTEAEWEFAARSAGAPGTTAREALGAGPSGVFGLDKTEGRPENVGSLEPNPLGLYDMAGNVAEWVLDWYAPDTYRIAAPPDPGGPAAGVYRVVRGGSWRSLTRDAVEPTGRAFLNPLIERNDTGFRCAAPAGRATSP